MQRTILLALGSLAGLIAAAPALAQAASVECAAAITENLGPQQSSRDLKPSQLPLLAYRAIPGEGEYKRLMKVEETAVGLFVYRVNDEVVHMQLFEETPDGIAVLADTALQGPITELTYRVPGGSDMVTIYCYR